ncbi:F-box domain protein [Lasiodiplodia theobromae]|uniref:F-box domain protein n=1 Tax=Lasiodiplodia theobromae TaxID=45133 RepID=UPI0015C3F354|nr:F-box domain protein [Lasiodiplodia theobromae]KAF4534970.1 F-box domain protein [Lasiodiplodia theobromae]
MKEEKYDEEEVPVNKKNLSLVRKFEQFPNLKAVTLRFSPNCSSEDNIYHSYPESVNFRQHMLREFVTTLAKTSITDVSILNLQNVNDEALLASEDFQSTISRLTSLTLQICTEEDDAAPECTIEIPELHTFFPALPRTWLRPVSSSSSTTLTRLALYSDHYFGWLPHVDLPSLLFPALTSLALGRYTLASPASFLAWLTRHAATLRHLTLHDCPILVTRVVRAPLRLGADGASVSMTLPRVGGTGRGMPPALVVQHEGVRWGDVFGRLGEMTGLREVRVSSVGWRHGARAAAREVVENLRIELSAGRYAWFDGGGYRRMYMWGGETRARLSEEGGEEWRGFVGRCGAGMDRGQDVEDVEALRVLLQRLGMREGRAEPVYLDRWGDGKETVVRFGG